MAQAHALAAQGSQPEELESALEMLTQLGIPIAQDKTVGPVSQLTFLGLEIDTLAMQVRIPEGKINEITAQIRRILVSVQSFPGSSTGSRACANTSSRQHMAHLKQEVDRLLLQSLSENTWSTYRTGINALQQFRSVHQLPETWPVPLDKVVNFIAHLSVTNHSPNTVKTYIAGISANHKLKGMEDCTNHFLVTKLITGMYKSRGRQDTRKPITLDLLKVVINNLTQVCSSSYEVCLFRAVYCKAFFGFFRVSELVQTKMSQPGCSINNVSISGETEKATIHLPHSKGGHGWPSDQRGYGNSVGIEVTPGKSTCPVAALKAYLNVRPSGPVPAFIHFDQSPLTRYQFQAVLKKALALSSIGTESYSSHSFRIGAATTAAINGVPPHLIQQYGRWKSECYQSYIRLPVT
ncbi:integrase/recombinase xerD homolog [Haliotis cracherodii]|uniref:integrase/recombinase xerD homolog n=1 Tax=Haliotis cracherodii TaxID=6455 RepID=UPI0039E81FE2